MPDTTHDPETALPAATYSPLRWLVLGFLFLATVLNYLDRQTLSILAPTIQRDLGMGDTDYARVVQLFLLAYTIAYLTAGWITDRLGSRLSLALFVGWWSIANMLTGFVRSAGELGLARFALGLGEAGNYTAAPKAVAERFPIRERGLALGIYTSGAMIGATLAPPLIGWLALTYGWRRAFVATGVAGLIWLIGWIAVNRVLPPIAATRAPVPGEVDWGWRRILTSRSVWSLALARTLTDPVWYFYLFWFPKYLADARGMSLMAVASLAWIVYLAADVGSVSGGWLSGRLLRRGYRPGRARIAVMGGAALIAPLGALIATTPAIPAVLALGAVVALAHMAFLVNLSTLIVDIFPRRQMATIFGIIAAGSGIGGIASTWAIGQFAAANHDYAPLFVAMAVLHPIGWLVARLALRKGEDHAA